MRLNQFRFLVALKQYGTISKTAEQLYISQPSLSAAIKELEEELGFELVKRTRKGVIFTAQGEQVLKHSQNILQEVDAILNLRGSFGNIMQGNLSVGCVPYIYHSIILDTMMELKARYPETVTQLVEDNSYALVKSVYQRELDLGVIMMTNIEQARWEVSFQKYQLEYQKLFDDEMFFWVGKMHPLYGKTAVTMEEALQYPFITYRNVLNDFNKDMLLKYNHNLDIIKLDDRESLYKYLKKSKVITVMPMCTLRQDSNYLNGFLKPLQIQNLKWKTQVGIVRASKELLSVEQREFMEILQAHIQKHNN